MSAEIEASSRYAPVAPAGAEQQRTPAREFDKGPAVVRWVLAFHALRQPREGGNVGPGLGVSRAFRVDARALISHKALAVSRRPPEIHHNPPIALARYPPFSSHSQWDSDAHETAVAVDEHVRQPFPPEADVLPAQPAAHADICLATGSTASFSSFLTSFIPPGRGRATIISQTKAIDSKFIQPPQPIIDDTELQELRAKIRVLEAKRADDARHVRELETRLSEAESFVALRPKLQAKLTSLQTDLIATRRELADTQQISQLAETRVIDAQEQLEMVLLDKEVAEERAELAETELEDVKEKLAILEVEMDVMKEGTSQLDAKISSRQSFDRGTCLL